MTAKQMAQNPLPNSVERIVDSIDPQIALIISAIAAILIPVSTLVLGILRTRSASVEALKKAIMDALEANKMVHQRDMALKEIDELKDELENCRRENERLRDRLWMRREDDESGRGRS